MTKYMSNAWEKPEYVLHVPSQNQSSEPNAKHFILCLQLSFIYDANTSFSCMAQPYVLMLIL